MGTTNRADEFLSNPNGYDNIVNSIYENLQHEDIPLSCTDTEVEITHDDFFHEERILFFKHSVPNTPNASRKGRMPLAGRSTSRIRRGSVTR